jgi:hypothetical protein
VLLVQRGNYTVRELRRHSVHRGEIGSSIRFWERWTIVCIVMNGYVQVVNLRVLDWYLSLCLVILQSAKGRWHQIAVCQVSLTLRETGAKKLEIFQKILVKHIFWHFLNQTRVFLHKLFLILYLELLKLLLLLLLNLRWHTHLLTYALFPAVIIY